MWLRWLWTVARTKKDLSDLQRKQQQTTWWSYVTSPRLARGQLLLAQPIPVHLEAGVYRSTFQPSSTLFNGSTNSKPFWIPWRNLFERQHVLKFENALWWTRRRRVRLCPCHIFNRAFHSKCARWITSFQQLFQNDFLPCWRREGQGKEVAKKE